MIFYLVAENINGIELSGEPLHLLMLFLIFCLSNLLTPQIIRFFVLPDKKVFTWIVRIATNFLGIYIMVNFLPGISANSMEIGPFNYESFKFESQTLQPLLTMLLTATLTSTFGTIVGWLSND